MVGFWIGGDTILRPLRYPATRAPLIFRPTMSPVRRYALEGGQSVFVHKYQLSFHLSDNEHIDRSQCEVIAQLFFTKQNIVGYEIYFATIVKESNVGLLKKTAYLSYGKTLQFLRIWLFSTTCGSSASKAYAPRVDKRFVAWDTSVDPGQLRIML